MRTHTRTHTHTTKKMPSMNEEQRFFNKRRFGWMLKNQHKALMAHVVLRGKRSLQKEKNTERETALSVYRVECASF